MAPKTRAAAAAPKKAAATKKKLKPKRPTARKSAPKTAAAAKKAVAPKGIKESSRTIGALRAVPCLGCLKSCLAGKQTLIGARGACYDTVGADAHRCYKCSSGHKCLPIPPDVMKPALEFLDARDARDADEMNVWRPVVKTLLRFAEEEAAEMGDDPNADLIKMTPEERRAAGRAAALRLFDCLWLGSSARPSGQDGDNALGVLK
ncbi:hypothetical protein S40285_10918, partial [Stachybotrys chlorohalonatus IBT 40285]